MSTEPGGATDAPPPASTSDPLPVTLPEPLPDRINLGCGWDRRDGYLNVDFLAFHEPDLVADATDLHMLPDDHFREVLAQDVLEHLERDKTRVALREWSRIMAPGGVLDIRVPSVQDTAGLLARPDRQSPERANEIMHLLYGTQAYTGDFHLAGFTYLTIADHLAEAGLLLCHASLRDEWLLEVTARKCARLTSLPERVHNRVLWATGRPPEPGHLARLLADPTLAGLTDAELDRRIEQLPPEAVVPVTCGAAGDPRPTVSGGSRPQTLNEAELVANPVRTVDLVRILGRRARRKARERLGR